MADQTGNPTGEGRILLQFLRNGGKLIRRGDDKDVLHLAQRLRDWMGIETQPFRFTSSRTLWNTLYESASLQPSMIGT